MKAERRKFTAEFKAQVAIEALKGHETLSQLSEHFKVSSVMISRWKSEFLANASATFADKRDDDAKDRELEQCYSKIGKLEMKLDFAKRASKALGDPGARRRLISTESQLSLNEQLELLSISKGSYYYKAAELDAETDAIMKFIDKEHSEFLGKGVVGMRDSINQHFREANPEFRIGERRVRTLMRKMNIHASYPGPKLSTLGSADYVHPYLLRGKMIERPNHVWSTDISYIPMSKGFLYLYAIIDVHSRLIVSWGLYNTLEAANAIEVLERGIRNHGAPEIVNSDQGSQYTCCEWVEALQRHGITISMDGRGRCKDNIWIERFWRTVKNEYVYFHPFDNGSDLRESLR